MCLHLGICVEAVCVDQFLQQACELHVHWLATCSVTSCGDDTRIQVIGFWLSCKGLVLLSPMFPGLWCLCQQIDHMVHDLLVGILWHGVSIQLAPAECDRAAFSSKCRVGSCLVIQIIRSLLLYALRAFMPQVAVALLLQHQHG